MTAHTTRHDDLLTVALNIATQAAQLICDRRSENQAIATKSSEHDIVTAIDQASEAFIVDQLRQTRPLDGIVAEEGSSQPSESGIHWVIDPLDGTVNFRYGIPHYAVSIAACRHLAGQLTAPIVGVVVNAASGHRWYAACGDGAWRDAGAGCAPVALRPAPIDRLADALIGTGFGYEPHVRARQGSVVGQLLPQVRDVRRFGAAALDLCAVADGSLDGYFEQGLKPWDYWAGALIVRESSRVCRGWDDARALGENPSQSMVLAGSGGLVAALDEVLRGAAVDS